MSAKRRKTNHVAQEHVKEGTMEGKSSNARRGMARGRTGSAHSRVARCGTAATPQFYPEEWQPAFIILDTAAYLFPSVACAMRGHVSRIAGKAVVESSCGPA
jgi:hypothetical protein